MSRHKLTHFQYLIVIFILMLAAGSTLLAQTTPPGDPIPLPASGLTGSGATQPEPSSSLTIQGATRAPFTGCGAVVVMDPVDCQALVDLYNATEGASWNDNTDWLVTDAPCTWAGVTCTGPKVTTLSLPANNLTGSLPVSIEDLTGLLGLDLADNQLVGPITTHLTAITSLFSLDLTNNDLSGPIPAGIENLVNLNTLRLGGNNFTGAIPAELGNMTLLADVNLSDNQLTGSIPVELGNLTNLIFLRLHTNQLTGTIPLGLENNTALTELDLYSNQLTGAIPAEFGNMTSLLALRLHDNQLTGSIPVELASITGLSTLELNTNQLTGNIPPELGSLANLQNLNLGDNDLDGTIPVELADLTSLTGLTLSENQLTGGIPPELANLTTLTGLQLSSNQLTGTIPPELGNLGNLTFLNLHSNQLSGSIPVELGNLTGLTVLYLQNNQLTGTIPTELGNLTLLDDLQLADNQLTGSIPTSFGNLTVLRVLGLFNNQLTGAIPAELGNMTQLESMLLFDNQLSGTIPPEIGNIPTMQILYLHSNQLTGTIPTTFGNFPTLFDLTLNHNQLTGNIPPEMGNVTTLLTFHINNNQFSGDFPAAMVTIDLASLEIGYNMLTASTPTISTYLNNEDLDWQQTQTASPADLAAIFNPSTFELKLAWTPIPYKENEGYYTTGCNTEIGDPLEGYVQYTADKSSGEVIYAGLPVGIYFCTITTTTLANPAHPFDLTSPPVIPISISVTVTGSPANDEIDNPEVIFNEPYQFYLANFNQATGDGSTTPTIPANCAPDFNTATAKSVYFEIPVDNFRGGPGHFGRGWGIIYTGGPGHFGRAPEADTIVAIYRKEDDDSLTLLACNDDNVASTDGSSVVLFNRVEEEAYRIVVWNKNDAEELILQAVLADGIANGSFDIDGNTDKLPDGWKVKNTETMRVKCKVDLPNTAPCALQIKGNGTKAQLKQKVADVSGYLPTTPLQIGAYVARKNVVAGGSIRLKLTYADSSKEKLVYDMPAGSSEGYEYVTTPEYTLTGTVSQLTVQIIYSGVSGRLRLDDVTLVTEAAEEVLPLPPAAQ